MSQLVDHDQRTRRVLRAVEPELRRELGVQGLDHDVITEVYLTVREAMLRDGTSPSPQPEATLGDALALSVYLIAASRRPDEGSSPSLLPRLERLIARALEEGGPGGIPDRPGGHEEDGRT